MNLGIPTPRPRPEIGQSSASLAALSRTLKSLAASGLLSLVTVAGLTPSAHAFTHPGMPLTDADLTTLNTNKNTAPWSTGYGLFNNAGEVHSKLTYVMQGPFATVSRVPDLNRNAFFNDMWAIECLAMNWKLTGDSAYADKARTILLAWANTHTSITGAEAALDAGDWMPRIALGASILRSYSGWSAADTSTVKNYFTNVWWPLAAVPNPLNSANQGTLMLTVGMGVAVYNDDTTKFNQVVAAFRNDACAGLPNTLSNGQVGDTGRDQGHAYGQLVTYSWIAEVAWKAAGVDLYALENNRLNTAGEYFSQYNNGGTVPFIQAGTCYGLYTAIDSEGTGRRTTTTPDALHRLYGAYVVRKGQSMPYLTAYRANQSDNFESWFYRKAADTSTATAPSGTTTYPLTSPVTALTGAQIDTGLAGSATYSAGTWTVKGSGRDIYGPSYDGLYYAYKQLSGDFAMIAKVTSESGSTNGLAQAGVMVRESLANNANMIAADLITGTGGGVSTERGATASDNNTTVQSHSRATLPYWVKVQRVGNTVTTYDSQDGVTWTAIINTAYATAGTVYVGLCVTSHDSSQLHTATFTNVSITGGGGAIPDGTYKLINRATGKCLDNGGSTTDGTDVKQWTNVTSNNLLWTVSTVGSYRKLSCVTGGKMLDSINHAANGTTVAQWTNSTSNNQQWTIQDLGTGYYKVVNRANGLCVDTGGQTADGASMQFWSSGSSNNQQWQFVIP